jgi:hypothetical protein
MISAVIATYESERPLVPTLAALVQGALAGILREVIIADGGSTDGTAMVADVSGCRFVVAKEPLGKRLRETAREARSPWLLFLQPGVVPEQAWVEEATEFIQGEPTDGRAAVFRRMPAGGNARSLLRDAATLASSALGALPLPSQGLLISKPLYDTIGGHDAATDDPERDLLRRLGRRRIVTLRTAVMSRS